MEKLIHVFRLDDLRIQYIYIWIAKIGYDLLYYAVIGKYFSYGNYKRDFNAEVYIMSILIFFSISVHLLDLIRKNDPLSIILLVFEVGYFLPGLTYCTFNNTGIPFFSFLLLYWYILIILYYCLQKMKVNITVFKSSKLFYIAIILVILLALRVCLKYGRFSFSFSFSNVYELRKEQEKVGLSLIDSYILPIAGTLLPFFSLVLLVKKKYIFSLFSSLMVIAVFSFGGMKKYLLYLVIAIFMYIFFRHKNYIKLVFPMLCMSYIMAIVEYVCKDGMPQIANYIHRRTMLMPVTISHYYFDFFSSHSKDFLAQGVLRRFGFSSEYKLPIPNMIGGIYFDSYDTVASNGLIGNAYSNFGWLSLLFYPILLIVLFKLIALLLEHREPCVVWFIAVQLFVLYTNGDYFTNLLFNGVIFLIIMLWIDGVRGLRKG